MLASTSSSRISSGAASTATWCTLGCDSSTASTSAAAMFSPLRRMMFLRRSMKCSRPPGSCTITSPVWNQPPSQALAVASGLSRYSLKKCLRGVWAE
ncbi:hypothetical protein D3C72_1744840 [compost metagenome]